jgi:hypothetical protein
MPYQVPAEKEKRRKEKETSIFQAIFLVILYWLLKAGGLNEEAFPRVTLFQ